MLALRHIRPDGSDQWFWRGKIDVADWEKNGEAWLPSKAMLASLSVRALLPEALPGLWPAEPAGGHRHEWGAAIADRPDEPLEGPALSPFEPARSGD